MNASLRNNEIEISFSSGIGYGMCFLSLYIGTYYNIILSWYVSHNYKHSESYFKT